jgi:hypothetical protein
MYSCFAVLYCIILCGWRPQIIISVVSGLKCLYFKKFSLKTEEAKGYYHNKHLLFGGIGSLRAVSVV